MSQISLVMRIMASSILVANKAGQIIRDVMSKGSLGIVEKGVNDLQTEADRSAQQCIIASLTNLFPGVKIIGEEGATDLNVPKEWLISDFSTELLNQTCPEPLKNVSSDDVVIWVDPLDGTSEYTQGFLERVTVLIGVSVKDRAIGGVIHQPYFRSDNDKIQGRTIWGVKGVGVGGLTLKDPPQEKLIVTTTRSHSTEVAEEAIKAMNATEVIKVGGAGYKVLQLLEGQAHAYVFATPGCKRWDTCAPEAVLEAANGVLTDVTGQHYDYGSNVEFVNRGGVLATGRSCNHTILVNKIPENVKTQLGNRISHIYFLLFFHTWNHLQRIASYFLDLSLIVYLS